MAHRISALGFEWYVPAGTGWAIGEHEAYLNSQIMNPGSHFIDVGAHIGRWTIPASKYYDCVTAFEPTPYTNHVLRVNLALNRILNVKVYQKAVSDKNGVSEFWLYKENEGGGANSILHRHLGHTGTDRVQVSTTTLDKYPLASLIKVDTEGWEYHVLRGGEKHLSNRTKLIVELHDLANLKPILGLLKRHGYSRIQHYPIPGYPDIETLVAE